RDFRREYSENFRTQVYHQIQRYGFRFGNGQKYCGNLQRNNYLYLAEGKRDHFYGYFSKRIIAKPRKLLTRILVFFNTDGICKIELLCLTKTFYPNPITGLQRS